MGHIGNWSPRKIALERRREAERESVEYAAKHQALRGVTLYAHHAASGCRRTNWFALHPCATFRLCHYKVTAECMGCRKSWPIEAHNLDDTPRAHRFWPAVMQELACPACGGCPAEIRFANADGEVGALSIRPRVTLQVFKDIGFRKPQVSHGSIDAFAQHDDGDRT